MEGPFETVFQKKEKFEFVPILIYIPKINLEHLELLRPWGLRASSLEAPGLHDTNLNKLSTQTPRGQELTYQKEWQINKSKSKNEKGLEFHAQPQTGAYSCSVLSPSIPYFCPFEGLFLIVGIPNKINWVIYMGKR